MALVVAMAVLLLEVMVVVEVVVQVVAVDMEGSMELLAMEEVVVEDKEGV